MRGLVHDRPFGKTVGMLARRGITGELVVESDGRRYALAFERGYIVAASSPAASDRAAAVALATGMIDAAALAVIDRWLAAIPDADEIAICAEVGGLSEVEAHRLRRRTIAQRAARIVALERGEFVLLRAISLPVVAACEMHAGGVIFLAARALVDPGRLQAHVEELGQRFELRRDACDELRYFGFGERERAFVRALAGGLSLEAVLALTVENRHHALAILYALAACGAVYCEAEPPRLARGTQNPLRRGAVAAAGTPAPAVLLATEPITKSTAADAFARGQRALQANRIDEALVELELALRLAPDDPTHLAALAWARFCAASDKRGVANETRRMLGRAIARTDPDALATPLYYLGLVERMLGRQERAAEHFREVLELEPKHAAAATELRFLTRRT